MNKCVKQNPNPAKAREIVDMILSHNIADQNEIIGIMRRSLADSRNAYIKKLQSDADDLSKQISHAEETLKTIIIGELK